MPWTTRDVDRFKRGLTDVQKRQWIRIANSVRARCIADGGSESACDALAIRQANGIVGHADMSRFVQSNENYRIREETYQGRRHLVVPIVMMVEGVHDGSHGPLFHPAEELGRWPGAWNGMPVVVTHPEIDGMNISANNPQIIDREKVGRVYNTRMDDTKLRAEAWLDEERLRQVSSIALAAIRQSHPLEVSVGVFTDDDQTPGEWNGEQYTAVARNHRPDHLALLPGGVGACSWSDGCGVRLNEKGGKMEINSELTINALRYSGTESTAWSAPTLADFNVGASWEALSAANKSKVASHYLIGSSTAATFGDLKLPVVNPRTGKLNERALRAVIGGRGAQVGGVSAEQKSAARRRAYRLLNSEFNAELTIPETLEDEKAANLFQLLNNVDQGFKELVEDAQRELDRMDNESKVHYLEEIYDDYVVYRVQEREGGSRFYKQSYQVLDDNSIDFTGHPTEVRKQIEYVAAMQRNKSNNKKEEVTIMSDKKKEETPCCEDLVNELIANERTKFTDEDKEWLLTLEEDKLQKFVPEKEKEPEKSVEPPVINKEQAREALLGKDPKSEDFLNIVPAGELRDSLQSGLKMYQERNAQMIEEIKKETDAYTDEELKGLSADLLEKTHTAIVKSKVDYSPISGVTSHAGDNEEEPLIPAEYRKSEKKKEE
jgi:hypothetical protein